MIPCPLITAFLPRACLQNVGKRIRERHVRLRVGQRSHGTVAIKAYAPVRIRESNGNVFKDFLQGAKGCLEVGQSLELDVDEHDHGSRCRYSYALRLATLTAFSTTMARNNHRNSTASSLPRIVESTYFGEDGIGKNSGGAVTDWIVTPRRRDPPYQAAVLETGEAEDQYLWWGMLNDSDDYVVDEVKWPVGKGAAPWTENSRRRKRARHYYHRLGGGIPFTPLDVIDLTGAGRDDDASISAGDTSSKPIIIESDEEEIQDHSPSGAGAPASPNDSATCFADGVVESSFGSSSEGVAQVTWDTERQTSVSSVLAALGSSARAESWSAAPEPGLTGCIDLSAKTADDKSRGDAPPLLPRGSWVKREAQAPSQTSPDVSTRKDSTTPHRTHRPDEGHPEKGPPSRLDIVRLSDLEWILRITVKTSPASVFTVTEELVARGSPPSCGLINVLVSELSNSACVVRTEYLRRQLRAILNVSSDSWRPPKNHPGIAGKWLDKIMLGITRNGAKKHLPRDVTILDAHVVILELIVAFLGDGCKSPARAKPFVVVSAAAAEATRIDKLRELFAWAKKNKDSKAMKRSASCAIAKCARWLVDVWRSTMPPKSARREETCGGASVNSAVLNCPVHARARLFMGRLLAEVVDSCGLPLREACAMVRDEVTSRRPATGKGLSKREGIVKTNYFQLTDVPSSSAALDAATLAGLMRSLCGRPLCATLAQQLLDDDLRGLGCTGEAGDVNRLKRLLMRVSRHPARGSMLLP